MLRLGLSSRCVSSHSPAEQRFVCVFSSVPFSRFVRGRNGVRPCESEKVRPCGDYFLCALCECRDVGVERDDGCAEPDVRADG